MTLDQADIEYLEKLVEHERAFAAQTFQRVHEEMRAHERVHEALTKEYKSLDFSAMDPERKKYLSASQGRRAREFNMALLQCDTWRQRMRRAEGMLKKLKEMR